MSYAAGRDILLAAYAFMEHCARRPGVDDLGDGPNGVDKKLDERFSRAMALAFRTA